ncbi:MAG: hypothetical protein V2J42_00080 [Wenzhouxiangella sp.]|jgi:hypothetical protein|nr:hypothetical protein [Wenzhouxiangella sp.]
MMVDSARIGYLQARLQARHGERPGEEDWRLIEASVDLLHYLDAIRASALKHWVRGISPDSSAAEIEMLLRANWRDAVEQVASWAPDDWREMLLWCRWLPDLSSLAHLLNGGPLRPWMGRDPVVRAFAFDTPGVCLEALADTELAPMHPLLKGGESVRSAWQSVLRYLAPDHVSALANEALGQLDRLLVQHRAAMIEAPNQSDGQALRKELASALQRVFRRASGTGAMALAFFGLEALEVERLRAGLVTRRLLKRVPEGLTWA